MSAYEKERAQVRATRVASARTAAARLLERIGKSNAGTTSAIKSGTLDLASKLVFEQQQLLSSLLVALSSANIESLRERAAQLFNLPLVQAPDGSSAPLRPAIIYCDPPWAYPTKVHAMGTHQHYDSMSDAELAALPVAGLAAEDAALLMWVTLPKLDSAHRIIEAWGFEFRAVFFVWNKVARYYGRAPRSKAHYTRPNAELLLLAIRGSMPSLKVGARNIHSNVLLTRPDDHSHKPEIVRQIIVETFGDLPRIELFARQTEPDWLAWGNEIAGSTTVPTALRGNRAQVRAKRNRQTGDAIKRGLFARKRSAPSQAGGDDDNDGDDGSDNDGEEGKAGGGGRRAAPNKRSLTTMAYLERYEQYNELTHDRAIILTAPDAEMLEHQRARTRFVAALEHPAADLPFSEPLSTFLSSTDLFNNNTLVPSAKSTSRSYPRLPPATLARAMPLIKQIQSKNSDTVFALANNLPYK